MLVDPFLLYFFFYCYFFAVCDEKRLLVTIHNRCVWSKSLSIMTLKSLNKSSDSKYKHYFMVLYLSGLNLMEGKLTIEHITPAIVPYSSVSYRPVNKQVTLKRCTSFITMVIKNMPWKKLL